MENKMTNEIIENATAEGEMAAGYFFGLEHEEKVSATRMVAQLDPYHSTHFECREDRSAEELAEVYVECTKLSDDLHGDADAAEILEDAEAAYRKAFFAELERLAR